MRGAASSAGLSAVVLCSYQGVSYFGRTQIMTQVSLPDRLAYLVVPVEGDAVLLICNLETRLVQAQTDVLDVREYIEFVQEPVDALVEILRDRGLTSGRIGIEARRLQAGDAEALAANLPSVEWVAFDPEVEKCQSVKQGYEIESLAYAAQSTRTSIVEAAKNAAVGGTETDFCADVVSRVMQLGGIPEFVIFGSGARSLETHAEPISSRMSEGEIWRIDSGARFDGLYNSDLARTGVVGHSTQRQEDILYALRRTQDAGFAALEPGRPANEVFLAVKAEFEKQKLPFFMPHIGHGLGVGLHEYPMLQPANTMRLEVGMVLCIEPMVQFPGENECYHVEDLVEVTDAGFRNLSEPQDALIQIGVA